MTVYRDRVPATRIPWSLFLLALGPVWLVTSYLQNIVVGVGRLVEISVVRCCRRPHARRCHPDLRPRSVGANGWLATLAGVFVVTRLLSLRRSLDARAFSLRPPPGIPGRYREVLRLRAARVFGTLLQGLNYRLDFFLVAFFMPIAQVGAVCSRA